MLELLVLVQQGNQGEDLLSNRVFIAVVAAAVGILITGIVNFVLQGRQDNRRFRHEREIQQERWDREDEVQQQRWHREDTVQQQHWDKEDADQRQRWDREDEVQQQRWERQEQLRNYDERRETYIEVMEKTNDYNLSRLQSSENPTEVTSELSDSVARLHAQLMLAPTNVRHMGQLVIRSYAQCAYAALEEPGELEQNKAELVERSRLFMALARQDLGVWREEDEETTQQAYKVLQEMQSSYSDDQNH